MFSIAVLLALALAPPQQQLVSAAIATPSCGDTTQFTRQRVENVLAAARARSYPGTRVGEIAPVRFSELTLLTDPASASVCAQIRTIVLAERPADTVTGRPWLVTVYSGRGFHFAVISRDEGPVVPQAGPVRIVAGGFGGNVVVLDGDLREVVTING